MSSICLTKVQNSLVSNCLLLSIVIKILSFMDTFLSDAKLLPYFFVSDCLH